jgi:predicted permease
MLLAVSAIDPAFDRAGVVTADVLAPAPRYPEDEQVAALFREMLADAGSLPGVARVGAVARLPLDDSLNNWSIVMVGQEGLPVSEVPAVAVQQVTPGYFETIGQSVLEGRPFLDADRPDTLPVAVVSASFAERYWPGEPALGQRFRVFTPDFPWLEVVGVVADVRQDGLTSDPLPIWYVPHAQAATTAYFVPRQMTVVVRAPSAEADLPALARDLQARLRGLGPGLVLESPRTMAAVASLSTARERLLTGLVTLFAAVALALALIGVYGVLSLSVVERTREIGVRMALGAQRRSLVARFALEAALMAMVGLVLGGAAAIAILEALGGVLLGVSPTAPAVLSPAAGLLLGSALVAGLVPAGRASRIDPVEALRSEA